MIQAAPWVLRRSWMEHLECKTLWWMVGECHGDFTIPRGLSDCMNTWRHPENCPKSVCSLVPFSEARSPPPPPGRVSKPGVFPRRSLCKKRCSVTQTKPGHHLWTDYKRNFDCIIFVSCKVRVKVVSLCLGWRKAVQDTAESFPELHHCQEL